MWNVCFIVTVAPIKSKASSTLVFGNSIILNLVSSIIQWIKHPRSFPWYFLSWKTSLCLWKVDPDSITFFTLPKYWWAIRTDVKYSFDSYCILITIFSFFVSTIFFFLRHCYNTYSKDSYTLFYFEMFQSSLFLWFSMVQYGSTVFLW